MESSLTGLHEFCKLLQGHVVGKICIGFNAVLHTFLLCLRHQISGQHGDSVLVHSADGQVIQSVHQGIRRINQRFTLHTDFTRDDEQTFFAQRNAENVNAARLHTGGFFLVIKQRCDDLAIRFDRQQVGCVRVGAFKHQRHIAQPIGYNVQQLLTLQALKNGIAVSGNKRLHGFVLSSPLLAKQKIINTASLGRVGLVGAGHALHIDPDQAQFAQVCLCQQLGNGFNVTLSVCGVHVLTSSRLAL
nr:MAG TPA: hypothetical protein [Bacteriophage sp.]